MLYRFVVGVNVFKQELAVVVFCDARSKRERLERLRQKVHCAQDVLEPDGRWSELGGCNHGGPSQMQIGRSSMHADEESLLSRRD
jgi:hypothetical protein